MVTTAIMAPLILIVGEIVPKSIARASAHKITLRVAGPLRAVQRVMFPVIAAVGRIAEAGLTVLGSRARKQSPYVTREELKAYDPGIAKLVAEVFGDKPWRYRRPAGRKSAAHLAGYDRTKAPRFAWPKRVRDAGREHQARKKRAKEKDEAATSPGRR